MLRINSIRRCNGIPNEKILFILITLICIEVKANDFIHSFAATFGTGHADSQAQQEDDELVGHHGVSYDYKLNSNYSVGARYSNGDGDLCFITCGFGEKRELDWTSWQVSAKGEIPVTIRWSAFARLGVSYNDVRFSGNYTFDDVQLDNNNEYSMGYVAALGIEFRANNGFKFGFEAQYIPMDIIHIATYGVYAGVSF